VLGVVVVYTLDVFVLALLSVAVEVDVDGAD
jgi:hypothetical protein